MSKNTKTVSRSDKEYCYQNDKSDVYGVKSTHKYVHRVK